MTMYEFFDPYDPNHIAAYRQLERNGSWPAGFLPDNLEMGSLWHVEIVGKMAQAWLKKMEQSFHGEDYDQ